MTRAGTLWPTIAAVATNGGLLERRIGGFRLEWTPYVGFLFRRYSDPNLNQIAKAANLGKTMEHMLAATLDEVRAAMARVSPDGP